MSISYEQAVEQLKNITTKEQLKSLIEKLSVETSGDTTILYSKFNGEDLSNLKANPNNRILDNTQASRFLEEALSPDDFIYNEFKRILGDAPDDYDSSANKFLFGEKDINGNRVNNGAWDIISRNFVEEAPLDSEIKIYAGDNI